jgi:hypothetical protein
MRMGRRVGRRVQQNLQRLPCVPAGSGLRLLTSVDMIARHGTTKTLLAQRETRFFTTSKDEERTHAFLQSRAGKMPAHFRI